MVQAIQEDCRLPTESRLVFVCGGNDSSAARQIFRKDFGKLLPGYLYFEPEAVIASFFNSSVSAKASLQKFEILVAESACCILVFPEGPGSFAEAGLFSGINRICDKLLLAFDLKFQHDDSFLSLGPAALVDSSSRFKPRIYIDYATADFSPISTRITARAAAKVPRTAVSGKRFSQLSLTQRMAITSGVVDLLRASSLQDLTYIANAIFGGATQPKQLEEAVLLLEGAGIVKRHDDSGLLIVARNDHYGLLPASKNQAQFDTLRLEIANSLLTAPGHYREAVNG